MAKNVKGVKLRARATGDLSNTNLNLEAVLREMPLYDGALEATTQAAA